MTTLEWVGFAAVVLLTGAALGAWAMARIAANRAAADKRRVVAALERRHMETQAQLRAAQLRLQAELDQTRNNFKRQLLSAADGPRAELARVNRRLQIAYSELDRMRTLYEAAAPAQPGETGDGFAATRPMPN